MGKRILNEALRTIVNAEKRGKATANLQPISNLMSSFLNIMKGRGYIKEFQVYDPHRVGKILVELQGRIKDIRVLMYRQDLKAKEIEEYRLRTLLSRQRILNEALRTIVNAEKRGKATTNLQPISNLMSSFLNIMKGRGYIKEFQVYDPHRVGKILVELQGRIKDIRVLMYRQDLKAKEIEEYRLRTLPSRQWGYVVVSTPNGVLDHEETIKQNVGGQVLGYFH